MSNERFKFRAWDKRKKQYANRCVIGDDGWAYQLHDAGEDSYDLIPDEDVIIEQCTGLKDKNGNLIYEGDVLGYADKVSIVVEWDCKNAKFHFTQISDGLDEYIFRVVKLEIIGNIHEMEKEK